MGIAEYKFCGGSVGVGGEWCKSGALGESA